MRYSHSNHVILCRKCPIVPLSAQFSRRNLRVRSVHALFSLKSCHFVQKVSNCASICAIFTPKLALEVSSCAILTQIMPFCAESVQLCLYLRNFHAETCA